jgi:hypothetical protein
MKVLGLLAVVFGSLLIAFAIMVGTAEAHLSDGMLLGLAASACFAVIFWSFMGAHPLPKWLHMLGMFPCIMFGISILMPASDRYPPLSPVLVGLIAVVNAEQKEENACSYGGLLSRPQAHAEDGSERQRN